MAKGLDEWLRASTRASGVPVKVNSPAVLAALQAMITQAVRRERPPGSPGNRPKQ